MEVDAEKSQSVDGMNGDLSEAQENNGFDDQGSVQGDDNDSQDEDEPADRSLETVADAVKKRKRSVAHRRFAGRSKTGSNSMSNGDGEVCRSDFSFRDFRPALHPIACKCESEEAIDPADTEAEAPATRCGALDHIDDAVVSCLRPVSDNPIFVRPSTAVAFRVFCDHHFNRLRDHMCCPRCGFFCTQGQFVACANSKQGDVVHVFHAACAEVIEKGPKEETVRCPHCLVIGRPQFVKIEVQVADTVIYHPVFRDDRAMKRRCRIQCTPFSGKIVESSLRNFGYPQREPINAFELKGKDYEAMMALKKDLVSFLNVQPKSGFVRCADITGGRELTAVQCVNEVDDEKAPNDHFVYITENLPKPGVRIDRRSIELSCRCEGRCDSGDCSCITMSFGCWYQKDGMLVDEFNYAKPPYIFECGPLCSCSCGVSSGCKNRIVQNGIIFQLELFRAPGRGWGVRALEKIPKGSFVCEYVGELITDLDAEMREEDSYLFDLDPTDHETNCIDARHYGNIARFINHLCKPNLTAVRVLFDHQDIRFPHIALFANTTIPAGVELGYDYGEKFWVVKGTKFHCACGSVNCKYNEGNIEKTLKEYRERTGQ